MNVAVTSSRFVNEQRIDEGLRTAFSALESDVVRIRYSVDENWAGEPAVYFRVVLTDLASKRARLREVARRVRETVFREVRPDELGLEAYFFFRGESEPETLQEEAWT